jgi:hypothetical protein
MAAPGALIAYALLGTSRSASSAAEEEVGEMASSLSRLRALV